eukprot:CAMPEP_0173076466 /NCGR_PEP_ID=MMETSP1102-20130122/12432_1 /TAXON_ID=49646 /ORGANISM="Geminigera sp., Strain Caron Lab Isolate" /LENGTH=133 /DNA_ID=CAMNT_0013946337 /DNA_START=564 /DNA_END=966 /DNA_ORIENTATION=+
MVKSARARWMARRIRVNKEQIGNFKANAQKAVKDATFSGKDVTFAGKDVTFAGKDVTFASKDVSFPSSQSLMQAKAIKNAGDGPPGSVCTPVWKKKVDCVHSLKTFSAGGSGVMDNQHYYMVAAWSQCGYLHK